MFILDCRNIKGTFHFISLQTLCLNILWTEKLRCFRNKLHERCLNTVLRALLKSRQVNKNMLKQQRIPLKLRSCPRGDQYSAVWWTQTPGGHENMSEFIVLWIPKLSPGLSEWTCFIVSVTLWTSVPEPSTGLQSQIWPARGPRLPMMPCGTHSVRDTAA